MDSPCHHVILQSLRLEMGWLEHVGQLRNALHCYTLEKKGYICLYVKSVQAVIFLTVAVLCLFFCAAYDYRI